MATVNAIKYGMKGDDVSKLQTTLKNAGYNIDVDGSFGPQTLAAVKDYQKSNGLTVDGMVGPQTQAALYGGTSTATTTPAATTPTTTTPTTKPATTTGGSGSAAGNANTGFTYDPYKSSGAVDKAVGDGFTYDDFNYGSYVESETVQQASAALNAALAAQPGAYQSKWADQVNGIIDKILNRESFSYDYNSDPLYKMYAEQYQRLGKLAMQDTMGQAAALTGGYGSSYASTAGNQAYQAYLSQLNEVVPELYGMALDKYNAEGQEMYNQYGLLSDAEAQDYGRYMDGYNQWLAERDYAAGRYDSERNFDYGKYSDQRNFDYGVYADDKQYDYNDYLAGIENAKWSEEMDYKQYLDSLGIAYDEHINGIDNQYRDKVYADSLVQQGVENDRADRELGMKEESWNIEKSTIADSTKSYSGNGFNNGTLTNGQIKELQSVLGVEVDGKFGPKSKEAAGGLSADEAYAKYVGGSASNTTTTTSKLTDTSKIEDWSYAILEAETEEDALMYVERLEQLDPELADSLYERWLKEHGLGSTTDTTVVRKPTGAQNYTGGGSQNRITAIIK